MFWRTFFRAFALVFGILSALGVFVLLIAFVAFCLGSF